MCVNILASCLLIWYYVTGIGSFIFVTREKVKQNNSGEQEAVQLLPITNCIL
jgi:hypothetical protein